jgi:hypothetical protein
MIPVTQQRWNDCLRTCIGSILEIDVDQLPFPSDDEITKPDSWTAYDVRLGTAMRDLNVQLITFKCENNQAPKGYAIANVWQSKEAYEKGDTGHAIVVLDGKEVWNPNPATRGTEWWTAAWTIITPIDAARPFGQAAITKKQTARLARMIRQSFPDWDTRTHVELIVDGSKLVLSHEEVEDLLTADASEIALQREREEMMARAIAAPPPTQKIVGGEAVAPQGANANDAIRAAMRSALDR